MLSDDVVQKVVTALNQAQIPYMIVGSLSSNIYGNARSTKDADFVVQLSGRQAQQLVAGLGPEFKLDPQMSFETKTGTTRYVIDSADGNFKIELFVIRVGDWGGYMMLDCDDPTAVHKFCSMLPAFVFEARPVIPIEDAVRVELESIAFRDGLKAK